MWSGTSALPSRGLASAFVAKAVLRFATTVGLVERLTIEGALHRICGFPLCKKLPSEATFSRAFDEFAETELGHRVHDPWSRNIWGINLWGNAQQDPEGV